VRVGSGRAPPRRCHPGRQTPISRFREGARESKPTHRMQTALAQTALPGRPTACLRPGAGAPRPAARAAPIVRATTGSGGGLETSVSLGPGGPTGRATPAPGTSSKAAALSLDDVDITSEVRERERERERGGRAGGRRERHAPNFLDG